LKNKGILPGHSFAVAIHYTVKCSNKLDAAFLAEPAGLLNLISHLMISVTLANSTSKFSFLAFFYTIPLRDKEIEELPSGT